MTDNTYAVLAAHFDVHFKDARGMEYLTGNQIVGRLNEVLGPGGWSFVVKDYGYDAESDEVWAIGHLEASIDGLSVVREQFGSQKHHRRRDPNGGRGAILDYGFDSKGAATDALKKCATLIGVGLYLSEKDGRVPQQEEPPRPPARSDVDGARPKTAPERPAASPPQGPQPFTSPGNTYVPLDEQQQDDAYRCTSCNAVIKAQTGDPINANQARMLQERDGRLTCREHRPKKAAAA